MKKVLIISSSLRTGSNSETLAHEFEKGAIDAGHQVEMISLRDKTIHFCKGCFVCQKTQRCFMRDDADLIEQKMAQAEIIVFATPIYYYEMSGQLKTLLDRGNPLYTTNYLFRDIYVLTTAAEEAEGVDQRAVNGIQGWVDCFEKAQLKDHLFVGGVTETNAIDSQEVLKKAYEMGYQC